MGSTYDYTYEYEINNSNRQHNRTIGDNTGNYTQRTGRHQSNNTTSFGSSIRSSTMDPLMNLQNDRIWHKLYDPQNTEKATHEAEVQKMARRQDRKVIKLEAAYGSDRQTFTVKRNYDLRVRDVQEDASKQFKMPPDQIILYWKGRNICDTPNELLETLGIENNHKMRVCRADDVAQQNRRRELRTFATSDQQHLSSNDIYQQQFQPQYQQQPFYPQYQPQQFHPQYQQQQQQQQFYPQYQQQPYPNYPPMYDQQQQPFGTSPRDPSIPNQQQLPPPPLPMHSDGSQSTRRDGAPTDLVPRPMDTNTNVNVPIPNDPNQSGLKIEVFHGSDRHVLFLPRTNNVRIIDLMEELQRITTVPIQNQKLYFRGQELQRLKEYTLHDAGVYNNSQVRLIGDPTKPRYEAMITGNRTN